MQCSPYRYDESDEDTTVTWDSQDKHQSLGDVLGEGPVRGGGVPGKGKILFQQDKPARLHKLPCLYPVEVHAAR